LFVASTATAQLNFEPITHNYDSDVVVVPASPLKTQVLFIGGVDMVQTTPTYGNPATEVPAKQWHDFIGFTPDNDSDDLGWVIVNHERIQADDNIGDGGGMTSFKIRRDANTDTLQIVSQTLSDGRSGEYFNVDFANTVGETGMNCGGISAPDGRIWTAEEWFRDNNEDLFDQDRDTSLFTIGTGTANGQLAPNGFPGFNGETMEKYQNYNWMVEVDAAEAVAVRKQYNWGRQPFEGGAVVDNQTVYLGADATPGFFTKFEADTPGDFTSGRLFVYKHDAPGKWIEIDNGDFQKMLNFKDEAVSVGATMFNRIEWVAHDPVTNAVYFTETGRDNPGGNWEGEFTDGAVLAPHHNIRAQIQGNDPFGDDYWDYYGRVIKFDLATEETSIFLEGGPYFPQDSVSSAEYPDIHLSNPDGLSVGQVNGRPFMIVQEDLNGTSNGRVPRDLTTNRICEMFLLDLTIPNPDVNDLVRISVVPVGAEITGAIFTPDGKTILVNSQHPSSDNPFPYNNSLTYAITGWDELVTTSLTPVFDQEDDFSIWPNPAFREIHFQDNMDVAIYDSNGQRILVKRDVNVVNISDLAPGVYFIQNGNGTTKKLVIQK
ncbi:MAG: alkaline phosphatase PhoX, partial [Bacteroidota bacterium]